MKVAVIQLNAVFADVEANLKQIDSYIESAFKNNAKLILFPEFFTSSMGFSDRMLDVAFANRKVPTLMKSLAERYNIIIGGSYLSFEQGNTYNRFDLVFPNGKIYTHKKDIPTQFENCYYTNGDSNNILKTPIGNIGVALCWEMIRMDTIKRMIGKVDFVLAGSCWWDLPKDAPVEKEPLRIYNQNLAAETPSVFAKLLGVPLLHSNHCGEVVTTNFLQTDMLKTRQFVGATQIINDNGEVVQSLPFDKGEGILFTELSLEKKSDKAHKPTNKFWIPNLPNSYINAWETLNSQGSLYYNTVALPYYKTIFKNKGD